MPTIVSSNVTKLTSSPPSPPSSLCPRRGCLTSSVDPGMWAGLSATSRSSRRLRNSVRRDFWIIFIVYHIFSFPVETPEFLSELDTMGNMWIFIGSPGYGAHLHLDDDLELPTWQAQISGVKTWFLQPPPECGGRCKAELQIDLHPGDMIIVNTNFWFHKTRVKHQGISLVVTQQIG